MLETISATQAAWKNHYCHPEHIRGGGGVIDHGQNVGHVLVANQITEEQNISGSETHEKCVDAQ